MDERTSDTQLHHKETPTFSICRGQSEDCTQPALSTAYQRGHSSLQLRLQDFRLSVLYCLHNCAMNEEHKKENF